MKEMPDSKMIGAVMFALMLLLNLPCHAGTGAQPDEKAVIKSYNETALQLYQNLAGKNAKNIVISPYSVGTAMAMALSGARGNTEVEMKAALNQTLSRESMDTANQKLLEKMNRFQGASGEVLSIANALCLTTDSVLVHRDYKELLKSKYHAEVFDAPDVGPINQWVSGKTKGKIEKILEKLSANSVCVLLNAVYFKGIWATQFDKKKTQPKPFQTASGEAVSVPMMRQKASYTRTQREDFAALSMPYKTASLEMILILPNEKDGLPKVEKTLSMQALQSVVDDLGGSKPAEVTLSLPRFKASSGASLIPPFQAMGMKLAFSASAADFGGITGRSNALGLIWIAQIQHKACLEVNEEGSEAAAVTAVEFATKSAPLFAEFRVDHPFCFLLVDKETGAILFMGRVNNPLETN
ncbi:MAG: serpin family protein [Verrucomicrobia bacterium]|nr:serpin family protein [Verrucomicrobiota bacterium]